MSKSITKAEESRHRFKVGSQAFFNGMPGFHPGDIDEIEFEEDPKLYRNFMQFRKRDGTQCLFKWRKMTADEFVEYTLNSKLPMEIGKFLVPEIAEYIGFTIKHLKRLETVIARLDEKHKYEKVIYDSYIQNNGFYLTEEQRDLAYKEYLRAKNGTVNERTQRHGKLNTVKQATKGRAKENPGPGC